MQTVNLTNEQLYAIGQIPQDSHPPFITRIAQDTDAGEQAVLVTVSAREYAVTADGFVTDLDS